MATRLNQAAYDEKMAKKEQRAENSKEFFHQFREKERMEADGALAQKLQDEVTPQKKEMKAIRNLVTGKITMKAA